MQELLYLEIPTPDTPLVIAWLQNQWHPPQGRLSSTPDGVMWHSGSAAISIFLWTLQRTSYLKVFRYQDQLLPGERAMLKHLKQQIRQRFPHEYPEPPPLIDGADIFTSLGDRYPKTVHFFRKIPNGEYDLNRAYWWEKRWRESVRNPQTPQQVIFTNSQSSASPPSYDLIYVGGALGVIHAAAMARLGYKVLLIERLPFARMNREWNISRDEFQSLINLGLFTPSQFESVIAKEYKDGFNKFFDANNPKYLKAPVLHTPTVLNIAIDAEKLLRVCGEKLRAAGGEIWEETEFRRADIFPDQVRVECTRLAEPKGELRVATGRLLLDAMGTASPIAWQLNGRRTFDSVCPTVGAVIRSGFEPGVWDENYGDVLNSHGDISRGRQLIWELFPGADGELTVYLFHYHQVNTTNPGSLLEMYEDFFTILPEYRRCDLEALTWRKATFGYIPGHFSRSGSDRRVAFDRLLAIGDAASLQSPLVFTGFGSLVRNLGRLTDLLDTALKHDLLKAEHLNQIRAYQSNTAVTWLFSKGMMVPTGKHLQPQLINCMLNTFFGILASEPAPVADTFIKDRVDWLTFNRLALKAAWQNPRLLAWIWQLAGWQDLLYWLGSYWSFTIAALVSWLIGGWLPQLLRRSQTWLEPKAPALWLALLAYSYNLTAGTGRSLKSPAVAAGVPSDRVLTRTD